MLSHALGVGFGLCLLLYGGEKAVEAAVAIARWFGVPTLLVGGTLVAAGSSIPEVATAVYAGLYGAGDFVVGHIIGSATSQITIGIGVVALLAPLRLERRKVGFYGLGMIFAMGLMVLTTESGFVTRLEGGCLVVAYLVFLGVRIRTDRDASAIERVGEPGYSIPEASVRILVGFALVAVGGHLLVTNSRALAVSLGVPEYLLGLVTGLGTTTPEIVIAALAVHRDEADIAVGTLFGSNVTDPLFSFGLGAVVGGFSIEHTGSAVVSGGYMLAVSTLVVALFYVNGGLRRRGALACIALYFPTYLL
jgi:cation:H+ antiporter